MLILVADDEQILRDIIKKNCIRQGHQVILAKNGEEALHLLQKNNFDMLITDNDMPKLKGLELIKIVQPQLLKLKIILISGNHVDKIPPGVIFLSKPDFIKELDKILKEAQ